MDEAKLYLSKAQAFARPYVAQAMILLKEHERKGTFKHPYVLIGFGVLLGVVVGHFLASRSGRNKSIANIFSSYEQTAAKIQAELVHHQNRVEQLKGTRASISKFTWVYIPFLLVSMVVGFRFFKAYVLEYYQYSSIVLVPLPLIWLGKKYVAHRIASHEKKIMRKIQERENHKKLIAEEVQNHIPQNALQLLVEENSDRDAQEKAQYAAKEAVRSVEDRTGGLLDVVDLMLKLRLESCSHNDKLIAELRPKLRTFAPELCGEPAASSSETSVQFESPKPQRMEVKTPGRTPAPRTPAAPRTVTKKEAMTPAPTPSSDSLTKRTPVAASSEKD